jgi:hypothetical protein
MRAAALLAVTSAALLLSGCGEDKVAPGAAQGLVRESQAIEARLAVGDPCGAERHARRLLTLSSQAIEAGLVPVELAPELRARAARLAAAVSCPPPPTATPTPTPTPQPAAGEDGGEDRDKGDGRGKKKGHDR